MEALFDDKYYQAEDNDSANLEKNKDIDVQLLNDQVDDLGVIAPEENDDISDIVSDDEKTFLKRQ